MQNENILELNKIEKSFSTVKVLKGVSLKLKRGTILGLCGENGAGKSTLMNVLCGVYQKDGGEILFDNKEFSPKDPLDAKKAGIAFIHQELNLFLNLTVRQNFMIEDLPKKGLFIDTGKIKKIAEEQLRSIDNSISVDTLVEDLNMGHRQMVEIAKETAKDAKVVVFDEPTSSLSTKECQNLFKIIREMAAKGISIIYISHIIDDIFSLCNEIMVLRDGATIGQKPVSGLTKNEVIHMMVGRELTNLFPYVEKKPGAVVFKAEHIGFENMVKDVSFSLRSGEIIGMFGLMGAGRSELANAVFGTQKMDMGEVFVNGKRIPKVQPDIMKEIGIAYITENRREEGLLMNKSVKENITLANLNELSSKWHFVDNKKEKDCAQDQINNFNIKTFDMDRQTASQFSGGNQQKIVFAKWLVTKPMIFILDEPTRGVDVGAKYEIYNYINELAKSGSAVLFISSEMEELMGVCDRIMVMSKGKLVGDMERGEYKPDKLLELAVRGGNGHE